MAKVLLIYLKSRTKGIKKSIKFNKINKIKGQYSSKNKNTYTCDSIVKHVEDWRLNKQMKSTVSVTCIPGATTNAMKHHLKGFLEYTSPDNIILHHGINNLKSDHNSEKVANNIVDLGLSVKNGKTMVYISSLVTRNDKLDKKQKEVNDFNKEQCLTKHLCFIDNENINLGMLNKSGLHLSVNGMK